MKVNCFPLAKAPNDDLRIYEDVWSAQTIEPFN